MGLMDKVKAQATQLAQKTQEAAQEGKAKLDQAQANRRGDALLRQLGAAVFADRTGRGGPDSQAKIDQMINDIATHERENGLNLAGDQSQQPGVPQQNFPADPPSPFPGPAASTFPDAGTSSFPDAGSTGFPDQGSTPSKDAGPSAFPDSGTGGQNFFPPEG
jgi:hypothetical protein